MTCFKNYVSLSFDEDDKIEITMKAKSGSLCEYCNATYNNLREFFWEKIVPSSKTGKLSDVCYDLRDAVSSHFQSQNSFTTMPFFSST